MNREALIEMLNQLKRDEITLDEALARLSSMPFEDLGFARVDHHRALRHGGAEVVFCQGKTPAQVVAIIDSLISRGANPFATRASEDHFDAVHAKFPDLVYYSAARVIGPAELSDADRGEGLVHVQG